MREGEEKGEGKRTKGERTLKPSSSHFAVILNLEFKGIMWNSPTLPTVNFIFLKKFRVYF